MAQGQEDSSGYDWERPIVPSSPPAPFSPPTELGEGSGEVPGDGAAPFGAPTFSYDPAAVAQAPTRRRLLPAWAIVAIVALQAVALVASIALVTGGIERVMAEPSAPSPVTEPASAPVTRSPAPSAAAPAREPHTVTDAAGRELTDGTGDHADPATIGEHTVSWRAWTHGSLGVRPLEVDLEVTIPGVDGADVVRDGYRLVLVAYEVRYDGPGQLGPAEELWLTAESDRSYFPDIAEGLVEDPMTGIAPLEDGESARFHSAFLVPEAELPSLRLGVETFTGEIAYYATP